MPGFPGVVLIPLGRLLTSPIPLLARVALWFHHPHLRAGHIQARHISESIDLAGQAQATQPQSGQRIGILTGKGSCSPQTPHLAQAKVPNQSFS